MTRRSPRRDGGAERPGAPCYVRAGGAFFDLNAPGCPLVAGWSGPHADTLATAVDRSSGHHHVIIRSSIIRRGAAHLHGKMFSFLSRKTGYRFKVRNSERFWRRRGGDVDCCSCSRNPYPDAGIILSSLLASSPLLSAILDLALIES